MENNKYYVYVYLDPRKQGKFVYGAYSFDYEPFYIGEGSGNRCYHHLRSKQLERHHPKSYKIKKLLKLGYDLKNKFIFKIKNSISKQESRFLEKSLIKLIGRNDLGQGPLTNLTDGGDGRYGFITPNQVKEKISKSLLGISHTLERRKNQSLSHLGNCNTSQRKLSNNDIIKIRKLYNENYSLKKLSTIFHVDPKTIYNIINELYYKEVR